jgi:transcriptional regulator with XRE-family HTH domain
MKGKRPSTVNALRAEILSDEKQLTPYVEQRLISQLGGLIDRVLTERQLTQTKLAQAVQMYQPDLNALIRGRAEHIPTIPTLRRLSAGLGVAIAIHIDPNGTIQLTEAKAAPADSDAAEPHYEAAG